MVPSFAPVVKRAAPSGVSISVAARAAEQSPPDLTTALFQAANRPVKSSIEPG
jgi:hypothetical protein